MKKASIVIGTGFGDEGKGSFTNYLCSDDPENTLVIRFSGGQQAGHTVMVEDKKHVFSNFGAGSLLGVTTYFTEHTSIYPVTIIREYEVLQTKGIYPKLLVHPRAAVTTPYDVAYTRARELSKSHGSCGLGVGSTMHRQEETGYKLFAGELLHPKLFLAKVEQIKAYYLERAIKKNMKDEYLSSIKDEYLFQKAVENIKSYLTISVYNIFNYYDHLIFEGSQGILLDREYGIFPNVTRSKTTSEIPRKLLSQFKDFIPEIFYITRCYQTRHGNGWMNNTGSFELVNTEEETNKYNHWQGEFRTQKLDKDLLQHAIRMDVSDISEHVTQNLVVTCLDQLPEFDINFIGIPTIQSIFACESPRFSTNQFKLIN